jgi:hypothetical protein
MPVGEPAASPRQQRRDDCIGTSVCAKKQTVSLTIRSNVLRGCARLASRTCSAGHNKSQQCWLNCFLTPVSFQKISTLSEARHRAQTVVGHRRARIAAAGSPKADICLFRRCHAHPHYAAVVSGADCRSQRRTPSGDRPTSRDRVRPSLISDGVVRDTRPTASQRLPAPT